MADYTPPDDLIKLRRDFLKAEAALAAAGRAMPSHAAVAAGEAEVTPAQKEEWWAAQDECRRLAVAIQEHPYWREVDDPKAARKALEDAVGGD